MAAWEGGRGGQGVWQEGHKRHMPVHGGHLEGADHGPTQWGPQGSASPCQMNCPTQCGCWQVAEL